MDDVVQRNTVSPGGKRQVYVTIRIRSAGGDGHYAVGLPFRSMAGKATSRQHCHHHGVVNVCIAPGLKQPNILPSILGEATESCAMMAQGGGVVKASDVKNRQIIF
jgi:hypothetical protein